MVFDEHSPRYHCCCGCVHAKIGALIFGVLEAIICVLYIVQNFNKITHLDSYAENATATANASGNATDAAIVLAQVIFWVDNVVKLVDVVAVGLLLIGLFMQNHYLVLPKVIISLVNLVLTALFFVFAMIGVAVGSGFFAYMSGKVAESAAVGALSIVSLAFVAIFAIGFTAWFFFTYLAAYRYYRDKSRALTHNYA